jgi:hypothetical protein
MRGALGQQDADLDERLPDAGRRCGVVPLAAEPRRVRDDEHDAPAGDALPDVREPDEVQVRAVRDPERSGHLRPEEYEGRAGHGRSQKFVGRFPGAGDGPPVGSGQQVPPVWERAEVVTGGQAEDPGEPPTRRVRGERVKCVPGVGAVRVAFADEDYCHVRLCLCM